MARKKLSTQAPSDSTVGATTTAHKASRKVKRMGKAPGKKKPPTLVNGRKPMHYRPGTRARRTMFKQVLRYDLLTTKAGTRRGFCDGALEMMPMGVRIQEDALEAARALVESAIVKLVNDCAYTMVSRSSPLVRLSAGTLDAEFRRKAQNWDLSVIRQYNALAAPLKTDLAQKRKLYGYDLVEVKKVNRRPKPLNTE